MGRSCLIIVLLLFTSMVFVKDLEIYALAPLEKMNSTVLKIEKNPFSASHGSGDESDDDNNYIDMK